MSGPPSDAIYLDHNGSAPVAPEVIAAMLPWLESSIGNPASGHVFGRRGRDAIEAARVQVAALIGAKPDEVIFTSGGTESNNLALKGFAAAKGARNGRHSIVTTAVEHPSVLRTCRYLEEQGFELRIAPVDGEGCTDADTVERLFDAGTVLVSVMLANNEVGTFQPVREIARRARARGIAVHCDAAQVLGKEPVDVGDLEVDMLTIAGHKLNAPKGVGALYLRSGIEIVPLLHGSGHEHGLRSGTQDVLEIVGLGAAAERYSLRAEAICAEYRTLRDEFETMLFAAIPSAVLNGPKTHRLVNTTNVSFPGVPGGELLARCPDLACAPGAACHKDYSTPSHVLAAMGLSPERAASSIRFSLGYGTTKEQLTRAVAMLRQAVEHRR